MEQRMQADVSGINALATDEGGPGLSSTDMDARDLQEDVVIPEGTYIMSTMSCPCSSARSTS